MKPDPRVDTEALQEIAGIGCDHMQRTHNGLVMVMATQLLDDEPTYTAMSCNLARADQIKDVIEMIAFAVQNGTMPLAKGRSMQHREKNVIAALSMILTLDNGELIASSDLSKPEFLTMLRVLYENADQGKVVDT